MRVASEIARRCCTSQLLVRAFFPFASINIVTECVTHVEATYKRSELRCSFQYFTINVYFGKSLQICVCSNKDLSIVKIRILNANVLHHRCPEEPGSFLATLLTFLYELIAELDKCLVSQGFGVS